MGNRMDEYINLLKEFYDDKFLFKGANGNYKGILERNDPILKLNKPWRINETIIKYRRAPGEGCKICEESFKKHAKIDFHNRPMEFPGFHESLDFNEENVNVKDIMIIGEAAGPTIATHVNFTYGLSNTDIIEEKQTKKEGKSIKKWKIDTGKIFNLLKTHSLGISKSLDLLNVRIKRKTTNLKGLPLDDQIEKFRKSLHNNLWERLAKILPNSLEVLKSKVYITDLVKCNARGNNIWKHLKKKCFESFLIHEISIINPKLIIFLGNSGYYHLKELEEEFKFEECCPTENKCTLGEPHECSKYKIYNFRDDEYLKSYYTKYKERISKSPFVKSIAFKSFSELKKNEKDKKKLIKKQTPPLYFPTFGTVSFKKDATRTPIKFIKIFHNSGQNDFRWKTYAKAYKDLINDLVEDKIITL